MPQNYPLPFLHRRIFPRTDEPVFEQPLSLTRSRPSPASPPPLAPPHPSSSSDPDRPSSDPRPIRFLDSATSATPPAPPAALPVPPPPLYYPGQNRLSLTSQRDPTLPPGHIRSTNTAKSQQSRVQWAYHPTAKQSGVWRFLRVRELVAGLRGKRERLWDGWPREFGGREVPPWEQQDEEGGGDEEEGGRRSRRSRSRSMSLSRPETRGTTGGDSGVALTPRHTRSMDGVQHPLTPLYKARIAELNGLMAEHLVSTRRWLALLEIGNYVWVVALIVALATGKGKQTGFLKGVEIALVLVILLNGTGVNAVRMRRWSLARALRQRQRDWSPLPLTLSTSNAQLMRNYLDGEVAAHNGTGDVPSVAPKGEASLRWRMRETEGTYWLSYRPIFNIELVTPASANNPLSYLPVVDPADPSPPPSPRIAAAARDGGGGEEGGRTAGGGTAPPGYEE